MLKDAVLAQLDATNDPAVKLHLRGVIERVQASEYIVEVPGRAAAETNHARGNT